MPNYGVSFFCRITVFHLFCRKTVFVIFVPNYCEQSDSANVPKCFCAELLPTHYNAHPILLAIKYPSFDCGNSCGTVLENGLYWVELVIFIAFDWSLYPNSFDFVNRKSPIVVLDTSGKYSRIKEGLSDLLERDIVSLFNWLNIYLEYYSKNYFVKIKKNLYHLIFYPLLTL